MVADASMERQSEVLTGCEVVRPAGCTTGSGEIDLANAPMPGQRIATLLGMGDLILDCRPVAFLDAAGLHLLAEGGVVAITAGVAVCLRCSPEVTETLNLCGVRELPGIVLDRDSHDSPGARR
jgi:anti-anti-sigma factor